MGWRPAAIRLLRLPQPRQRRGPATAALTSRPWPGLLAAPGRWTAPSRLRVPATSRPPRPPRSRTGGVGQAVQANWRPPPWGHFRGGGRRDGDYRGTLISDLFPRSTWITRSVPAVATR